MCSAVHKENIKETPILIRYAIQGEHAVVLNPSNLEELSEELSSMDDVLAFIGKKGWNADNGNGKALMDFFLTSDPMNILFKEQS
jgi:hypothetical protein